MDIKFYIKQSSHYEDILKDWKVYLESFQKKILSNEKYPFKIRKLNDRKELITFNDLEGLEVYNEIDEIHKLIKKERELYNSALKLIQEPEEVSFFTTKNKIRKIRNEQFSKYFKKLLSINSEQATRLSLFTTSLELLYTNSETTENSNILANTVNTVIEEKTEVKKDIADEVTITKENNTNNTTTTVEEKTEVKKDILKEAVAAKENKNNLTNTNNTKDEKIKGDFDYDTEMNRILGL